MARVVGLAVLLTVTLPPLLALLVLVDLLRGKWRIPMARLAVFAWCWAWLETFGVARAAGLWLVGRRGDHDAHYALQRWWAHRLMGALRATCGVRVEVEGVEALRPAPTVLLARHASIADALLTAWVVTEEGLHPRVVLKRELLSDACLDVVGNRLPNCFVDRDAEDQAPALAAIEQMAATMDERCVAIIFPEGALASPGKRARALDRIASSDPVRAARLRELTRLLPPRPSGSHALLRGASRVGATVTVMWHTGLDGMDTFAGIIARVARPVVIRVRLATVEPPSSLEPPAFAEWLDDCWLRLDDAVAKLTALAPPP